MKEHPKVFTCGNAGNNLPSPNEITVLKVKDLFILQLFQKSHCKDTASVQVVG